MAKRELGYGYSICLLSLMLKFVNSTAPTGCSYDSTDSVGLYTCDFSTVSLAISYYGFNPYSQRLKLRNINGNLPASGTFSGYSGYNSGSFDTNFAASLELECSTSASTSLTISANTFAGMGYVQEFKITNCYTSNFPANVFSDFGELDSLIISGGTVDGLLSDSFGGVDIKNLAVPNSKASFEMSNTVLTGGVLPANLLAGFTSAKRIVLDNIGLTSITAADFSSNTNLTHLSLKWNAFTTMPSDIFTGLDALSSLVITGIQWDCSCTNLWFLDFATINSIDLVEEVSCGTPSSYSDKKVQTYYQDTCVVTDICAGVSGIVMGTFCLSLVELVVYIILLLTLVISAIAIILVLTTRKEIMNTKFEEEEKKFASWNIVLEALRRRDGVGKKPPAAVLPPKGMTGWM